MNLFALLSFISFLISLIIGAYVLIKAPEKRVNIIFFIFSLMSSVLCFIEYELRMSESLDRAMFWARLQSVWPFVLAFSLNFIIELKGVNKYKKLKYVLIYVPAVILFFIDLTTNFITDIPYSVPWGWSLHRENNFLGYFSAAWAGLVLLLSVYLPFKYYLEFSGVKKKQVHIIFIAFVINLVFALFTDVIFPFSRVQIPELSNTLSIIPFVIIAYAMWKYQLFEINPNSLTGKLLMTLNDSVFMINSDLEIIEVNDSCLKMLDYKPDELLGKSVDSIVNEQNEEVLSIKNISKNVEASDNDFEISFCKKDKSIIPVSVSLSAAKLRNNEIGYILVARDISARKQAEDALNSAYNELDELVEKRTNNLRKVNEQLVITTEKAKESDRLKTAFLANMSHEIRTPMNGILGFAELLKEPNLSGELQQQYIKIIEKSGDRMLNIINDIVSISRIESGIAEVNSNDLNINTQQEYLYDFFKPEAEAKNISLSFNCALTSEEANINTDQDKFMSIYTNLIKNALKYTDKGSIVFGYSVKDSFIEFYIRDTGIGIDEERQEAVFERFIQEDIEDKMAQQGAGLGLAISKAYVEMLGGLIWLESKKNIGSTFFFTIPYSAKNKRTNDVINIVNNNDNNSKINNLKILVVEDDETSALFINLMFEKFDNVILRATNGLDAIDICKKEADIDLILMDIRMPIMNGYEATKEIRKFNQNIIIIAQSAFALTGDAEKAIKAGCNAHISKPINTTELYGLIDKLLYNKFL